MGSTPTLVTFMARFDIRIEKYNLISAHINVKKDVVLVAQWIARWISNPKVPGSNPGWDNTFFRLILALGCYS